MRLAKSFALTGALLLISGHAIAQFTMCTNPDVKLATSLQPNIYPMLIETLLGCGPAKFVVYTSADVDRLINAARGDAKADVKKVETDVLNLSNPKSVIFAAITSTVSEQVTKDFQKKFDDQQRQIDELTAALRAPKKK